MASGKLLDYVDENLCKDGRRVDWFRVAGVLTELGLKASLRHGNTVAAARHLPTEVDMDLDGLGMRRVKAHDKERAFAARVARLIRVELMRLGLEIRDVIRRAASAGRRRGAEHDMVLEVVDTADEGPIKKVSGELKLRRLLSPNGLHDARKKIQREAVDECQWWQAEAASGKWQGRLVVMCRWATMTAEGNPEIRTDFTPVGGQPRGFSGWVGSRRTFKMSAPEPPPPPPARATTQRPPTAPMRVAPPPRPFPALVFRRDEETHWKRVAEVGFIYEDLGKPCGNIGRDMEDWKNKFPTYKDAIFTAPRKGAGRKRGGKEAWYATEPALCHMHSKRLKIRG